MTGFLQQQPAAGVSTQPHTQLQTITSGTSGVQEIPLDMKAIHDHMAVQALVRSYQVSICFLECAVVWFGFSSSSSSWILIKKFANSAIINILLQMRGHKLAQLDPLGISSADLDAERPNDLTFKFYNFSKNYLQSLTTNKSISNWDQFFISSYIHICLPLNY